jgi:hypothetical protein
MPGYMAGIIVDWEEFKKGKVVTYKISSSPPPVDTAKLAEEALKDEPPQEEPEAEIIH